MDRRRLVAAALVLLVLSGCGGNADIEATRTGSPSPLGGRGSRGIAAVGDAIVYGYGDPPRIGVLRPGGRDTSPVPIPGDSTADPWIAATSGGVAWIVTTPMGSRPDSLARFDVATATASSVPDRVGWYAGDSLGTGITGVAALGSRLLVTFRGDGVLREVDPTTGAPTPVATLPEPGMGLTSGCGWLWVSSGTVAIALDPVTYRRRHSLRWPTSVVPVPVPVPVGRPEFLCLDGQIWVSAPSSNRVLVIAVDSGDLVGSVDVGNRPSALAAGFDSIWVIDGGSTFMSTIDGHTLVRIDPRTRAIRDVFDVGSHPTSLALTSQAVWVESEAASGTSQIVRVDP